MDATVVWQGRMSFQGRAETGFTLNLGTEPEHGGDNDGFRPMELVLIGLVGCTAMDVISILRKKRQDITHFEVRVHAERAERHPRVFTSATIEYLVTGRNIDASALARAIDLSRDRYCPVQAMLGRAFAIKHKQTIIELEP
jgi:putative redox protein